MCFFVLIGAGTVRIALPTSPSGPEAAVTGVRVALAAVAVVVVIVTCTRVAAIPSLDHAGDPRVGQLAALVVPRVAPGQRIAVGDAGAGTVDTRLLDTEEFIGLVDLLDRSGYRPTVNDFWKAQFGPGFRTDGTEPRVVGLSTWTPRSPELRGYVGHVGDMAVTVTDRSGGAVPAAG